MKPALFASLLLLPAAALAQDPTHPGQPTSKPLFNGRDLTGWTGGGYVVEDGAIVCTPDGVNLTTEGFYANYTLDFEFKLPPGGNNGMGIEYPGTGDSAYTGLEIQVLDDSAEKHKDLLPSQYHGSIYKLVAAKRGFQKPVGEWNRERIEVDGPHIKVTLNGTLITEGNLDEINKEHPDHEGAKRRSGHITLCGHGDRVAFRNLAITETPPAANYQAVQSVGFTPLFDGTLKGWDVQPGDEGHWAPWNGMLTYDGTSDSKEKNLWTEKEYGDFTLVCDWRWAGRGPKMQRPIILPDGSEKKGADGKSITEEIEEVDSGIYLRGSEKSQVNLWNWSVGSGEVYGFRTNMDLPPEVRAGVTPSAKADKPLGQWNRMMVTMQGQELTVVLNGQTVIDHAKLPGVAAKGKLALQHHGAAIDFANMWIKEL
jgi:hypothetical protein